MNNKPHQQSVYDECGRLIFDEYGRVNNELLEILARSDAKDKTNGKYILVGELRSTNQPGVKRGPFYGSFETYEEAQEYAKSIDDENAYIMGPRIDDMEETTE